MNIDTDTHYVPPDLVRAAKYNQHRHASESLSSMKLRIDAMKEAGFDKACLLMQASTIPDPFIDRDHSISLTSAWNDRVAQVAREYPEFFIPIAQVSHQDIDAAMAEADRAVRDLGFRAIQIVGNWGDACIEHPDWLPFYEQVQRLGVPLWFHTTGNYGDKAINPWLPGREQLRRLPPYIGILLGFLWHAQLVASGMIFSGIFEKFPKLRIVLTECDAGWVPSFMDWLDSLYSAHLATKNEGKIGYWEDEVQIVKAPMLKRKPSTYLRTNFLFSQISTTGYSIEETIPWLVNNLKMEKNIMIESDYPHSEGSLDIVRRIRNLHAISEEARERICGRNAAELLNIKWAPSAYAF